MYLLALSSIKLQFSMSLYPQMNGLAADANRVVQTFLRAYAVDNL
jgi:hypothetical protein